MLLDTFMQVLLCLLATLVGLLMTLSMIFMADNKREVKQRLVDILASVVLFGFFVILVFESFDWVLGG